MTSPADRIAQFEKMCREDPENDMAHFSLGGAYNQAGRFGEAAAAYARCTELNPGFSKAYQLAGAAYMAAQDTPRASEILLSGYQVAAVKGDLMPRRAIAELLEKLGVQAPEVEAPARAAGAGDMVCRRTGRPGSRMARAPFRGAVGEWIAQHITSETWNAWIAQGTKVINELRLDLSRDEDSEAYDRHMREYLGIDDEVMREIEDTSRA